MSKTMTNGKTNKVTLEELFNLQLKNQETLINKGSYNDFSLLRKIDIPCDDPRLCSYHIQQLISEVGEVLEADKRWKSFRNTRFDKDAKLEEIADCFIVLMNVAMFSGFNGTQLTEAIQSKLNKVSERIGTI